MLGLLVPVISCYFTSTAPKEPMDSGE
jgi:hypothetical protein